MFDSIRGGIYTSCSNKSSILLIWSLVSRLFFLSFFLSLSFSVSLCRSLCLSHTRRMEFSSIFRLIFYSFDLCLHATLSIQFDCFRAVFGSFQSLSKEIALLQFPSNTKISQWLVVVPITESLYAILQIRLFQSELVLFQSTSASSVSKSIWFNHSIGSSWTSLVTNSTIYILFNLLMQPNWSYFDVACSSIYSKIAEQKIGMLNTKIIRFVCVADTICIVKAFRAFVEFSNFRRKMQK